MIKRLRDSTKKDNRWQINRKRCSVSWAIRETNIRATKTYHIPVTVAKAKHISVGHWGGSAGKGFCCRAWWSEFDPWETQARRQLTPPKLSPYYHTRATTHVPPHTQSNKCKNYKTTSVARIHYIYTYEIVKEQNLLIKKCLESY